MYFFILLNVNIPTITGTYISPTQKCMNQNQHLNLVTNHKSFQHIKHITHNNTELVLRTFFVQS